MDYLASLCVCTFVRLCVSTGPPVVIVDRDNVEVDQSCIVEIHADLIEDSDRNGVIHIVADDITVEFFREPPKRELIQVAEGTPWDAIEGIGIRIDGRKNVTLRNAHAHRFKVGIYATNADGLTLENCDVAGGYQKRLGSTPEQEDSSDWLWPHANDNHEWMNRYGAGIYVEDSDNVTIRGCFARRRQNGIILDNVNDSRIYDNDCSFLSGWGLAMWRSNRNMVSRNAFDFCVRGYSHGVYSRGQDSAGILMFEQCSDNIIAENSATHGGDGFFGFGGSEALGEKWLAEERARLRKETGVESVDHLIVYPAELIEFCKDRGNNRNILIDNDFSYAVAHGIEMTFSFDNQFIGNRIEGCGFCGVWGGYSQRTLIVDNDFIRCGFPGNGLERGGVNIEHGRGNRIQDNRFDGNACGVHVWWDEDPHLMPMAWSKANDPRLFEEREGGIVRSEVAQPRMLPSIDEFIAGNSFTLDRVGVQTRNGDRIMFVDNTFRGVGRELDNTDSQIITEVFHVPGWERPEIAPLGEKRPVGARAALAGRHNIIVTEWGPYDWRGPLLHQVARENGSHVYHLLGELRHDRVSSSDGVSVQVLERPDDGPHFVVKPEQPGSITPYEITVETPRGAVTASGVIIDTEWNVRFFPYQTDPRDDPGAWRAESERDSIEITVPICASTSACPAPRPCPASPTNSRGHQSPQSASAPSRPQRSASRPDHGVLSRRPTTASAFGWMMRSSSTTGLTTPPRSTIMFSRSLRAAKSACASSISSLPGRRRFPSGSSLPIPENRVPRTASFSYNGAISTREDHRTMQIQINSGHMTPTAAIEQHIETKIDHEMKRFADRITRVEVHLRDDNGPKGGADKHCLLEARLAGLDPVVAEHAAGDMYLAIDTAAKKLHRAIEHKIERHDAHLSQ